MQTEKVEEEEDAPEEYVALCDFTASGSEQVILLPVILLVRFCNKTASISHFAPFCSTVEFHHRRQAACAQQVFSRLVVGRTAGGDRLCSCQLSAPGWC